MAQVSPVAAKQAQSDFSQVYGSVQSLKIDSAMLNKLNQRLESRGSELRLTFDNLSWSNLSIALYGTAAFASQLQALNDGSSSPSVNSPNGFDDFMCWVSDSYCWSTYSSMTIKIPSNSTLAQFLSAPLPQEQPEQPTQPTQPPVINPPVNPPTQPTEPTQPTQPTQPMQPTQPTPPAPPRIRNLNVSGSNATFTVSNINLQSEVSEIEVVAQNGSSVFFENSELNITANNRFSVPIDTSSAYTGEWRITVTIKKNDGTTLTLTTKLKIETDEV